MIMVFNKIDAFTYTPKDENDLTPQTRENISLDELKRMWMSRLPHDCVFISARTGANIDELKKTCSTSAQKKYTSPASLQRLPLPRNTTTKTNTPKPDPATHRHPAETPHRRCPQNIPARTSPVMSVRTSVYYSPRHRSAQRKGVGGKNFPKNGVRQRTPIYSTRMAPTQRAPRASRPATSAKHPARTFARDVRQDIGLL